MAEPSVPVSLRLSADDARWLASLEIDGASSLGEKLRALLRKTRAESRTGAPGDYAGWLTETTARSDVYIQQLRQAEFARDMHSELLARFGTWLPESLAFCLSEAPGPEASPEQLVAFEAGLARRAGLLAQQLLQLAVAGSAPTYDPGLPETVTAPLTELADAARGRKGRKKQKK
ncbi:MAG: hypothetical protein P8102_09545 [Gammaproteobacteria bacterium]